MRAIVATAIFAIVGAWMLPAEHLHFSSDHGATLHRHAEPLHDHAGQAADLDGHHPDSTLSPVYLSEPASRVERPVATVFAWHVAVPVARLVSLAAPLRIALAHGPPRRLSSPRAPPA